MFLVEVVIRVTFRFQRVFDMKYEVRKLELRDVLDQTCQIIRDNQKLLFGIVLVSVVPVQIVIGILNHVLLRTGRVEIAGFVSLGTTFLVVLPVYNLAGGALTYAVANLYLSRPTTMGESYRRALRRFVPIVLTSILQYLAIGVGFCLFIIPGIIFGLWFTLSEVVVVLEGTSGVEALKRSKALMKGNTVNLFALTIILWYFNVQLGMSSALVPSVYLQVVLASFLQGLAILVSYASIVIFYVSCRCQHDHFDLQWLASRVAEPNAEPA